jgi:multiple sugar transport system substrate-binding protein
MTKIRFLFLALLLAALVACGGTAEPTSAPEPAATTATEVVAEATTAPVEEPVVEEPVEEEPGVAPAPEVEGKVNVRWYVGLGAGTDEPTFLAQQAIVDEFNASQDGINLILEIVDNDSAYDILNTQIAAGNAPDIIGPMGVRGRASFPGAWLDMDPYIEKTNYDLSDFDPALVEFYRVEGEGQLGLPFAVFPSFIFVNKELFDEAGLPYPPQEFGAPYIDENGDEQVWDMDTMRELALKLTVDANGNDATSPDFDSANIVQFGFGNQWTDIRGMATFFGPGALIDGDGNAQFPDQWKEAVEWYYEGMWDSYFYPNGVYGGSDILGAGNWFESGNLAMGNVHLWYAACCIGALNADWDTAVVPSYNGEYTAKLHADTFGIMKSSKNPDAAFEVLTYLLGEKAGELATIYGGMPARLSLQDSYFDTLSAGQFAGQDINWDVVAASLGYPDNPNHEEGMPAFLEASDRYNEFGQLIANDPNLDLDAEIEKLITDLQAIFDAAQ